MAVFDTVIVPTSLSPANTSEATLYTGVSDTALIVDASNIDGTNSVDISIGVQPASGSTTWLVRTMPLPAADAFRIGPIFIRVNDLIRVQIGTANDASFTAHGVRST